MGLKDLNLKSVYDSDEDNLLQDFYIPVLSASIRYNRMAGFFSSNALAIAARGIAKFIQNGGKIKLIANVVLTGTDQIAIKEYLLNKENEILLDIENMEDQIKKDHIRMLSWMLKSNLLEIKIANMPNGLEHQKWGILEDSDGNKIVFSGSDNETVAGWLHHHEDFHVFCSWIQSETPHLLPKIRNFKRYWENKGNKVRIYSISDAFKERLIRNAPSNDEFRVLSEKATNELLNENINFFKKSKGNILLRDYQDKAITEWINNNFRGIFEMATGTGKTYTSLFAVKKYIELHNRSYALIICCPYKHLVDQWEQSIKNIFKNVEIVKCYDNKQKWYSPLNDMLQSIIFNQIELGVVITTTATGSKDLFIETINSKKINKVLIADEVHSIGSEHNKKFMNIKSIARIGLSATPIRPYDEEGNKAIKDYFGSSIYKLGIKEAISRGFLVPYNYYVSHCTLSDLEYEKYKDISMKIAGLYTHGDKVDEDKLQYWLRKRAKLLSTCSSKLVELQQIIDKLNNIHSLLVYTAEDADFFENTLNVLERNDITTLQITAEITTNNRLDIIRKLTAKDIQCILAIRCLDEGVDIPSADKAIILASSSNSKQYIQRRGRVLRKSDNGKKSKADIYDFIVLPPVFANEIDKGLFKRELTRVLEFASSANNYNAIHELLEFSRKNKLLSNFADVFEEFTV